MSVIPTRNPPPRKPPWLKVRAPAGESYQRIKHLRGSLGLATVCEEARCPNLGECWGGGTATFMVLGDVCTRACRFCSVKTGHPQGRVDAEEPAHLARAVQEMRLRYAVITMVDRDDLPDGGAAHLARCVEAVALASPGIVVEVLAGDLRARRQDLATVARSPAQVLAHNVETVKALTRRVRDAKSSYEQSLQTLHLLRQEAPEKLTKSSLMLGMGETPDQVQQTLADLRGVGVDLLTLGQYLQPTARHLPVAAYLPPETFSAWQQRAEEMGFLACAAGPLVRSSYRAGELFAERWLRAQETARKGG